MLSLHVGLVVLRRCCAIVAQESYRLGYDVHGWGTFLVNVDDWQTGWSCVSIRGFGACMHIAAPYLSMFCDAYQLNPRSHTILLSFINALLLLLGNTLVFKRPVYLGSR